MSATKERPIAELDIDRDTYASVLVDIGEPALRRLSLDDLLAAALQRDQGTAAVYRGLLAQIAPQLRLTIRLERDGSQDSGCSWYVAEFYLDTNGREPLNSGHRLGSPEYRGWTPSAEQQQQSTLAILRKAQAIGLGQAKYQTSSRTVSGATHHG